MFFWFLHPICPGLIYLFLLRCTHTFWCRRTNILPRTWDDIYTTGQRRSSRGYTQERCLPSFSSREGVKGFSHPFHSSTVKSAFVCSRASIALKRFPLQICKMLTRLGIPTHAQAGGSWQVQPLDHPGSRSQKGEKKRLSFILFLSAHESGVRSR